MYTAAVVIFISIAVRYTELHCISMLNFDEITAMKFVSF